MVAERRKARRFNVGWAAAVKGTDSAGVAFGEDGMLENLSSTGAYVQLSRYLQPGERLELWIKVPLRKDNWMKYSAEVVRSEQAALTFGTAMKFDTIQPAFVVGQSPLQ
jgi:hypothetical protein